MEIKELINKYESKPLTLPALPTGYIKVTNHNETWTNIDLDQHSQQNCLLPFSRSNCHSVRIKSSRLLTKSDQDTKKVFELLFDIEEIKDFQFSPGDTVGILPVNSDDEVCAVVRSISSSDTCDQKISIEVATGSKKKLPTHLPPETSIRRCLRECLDLHAIPKKLFLRSLIDYLSDDEEKRFLAILCSKEAAADYNERILNTGITFLDLLTMLQSWNEIPFRLMLEHLPRLLPRPYSIANSPCERNVLKIWFSSNEPPGVTTKMLQNLIEAGESNSKPLTVPIYLRQSNAFTYDVNEMIDLVIMIAAGVGVAPFLGFLDHREFVRKSEKGVQPSKAIMFYGCRRRSENLCDDVFRHHLQVGSLNELKEAFSRDADTPFKYVQDQIKANATLFVEQILKGSCRIYVCGSASMVQDVKRTIQGCLADSLDGSDGNVMELMQKLISDKRYIEDTWI